MKCEDVLFIGNGVNRVNNNESWNNLLVSLLKYCNIKYNITDNDRKQFPLFYEKIYLKSNNINELDLKKHIAEEVKNIKSNEIHKLIKQKSFSDIITTNYDYTLQKNGLSLSKINLKNKGVVKELKFSVFRHNIFGNTKFWHIHGECNLPQSINLGYEHYSGQLQKMRDYVISGTDYKKKDNQEPLTKRIRNNKVAYESWIDLFFTKNIHIMGLSLDFEEIDLWWLLTYRARFFKENNIKISNRIYFYINTNSDNNKSDKIVYKLDLLESMNVEIIKDKKKDYNQYYKDIINNIDTKKKE